MTTLKRPKLKACTACQNSFLCVLLFQELSDYFVSIAADDYLSKYIDFKSYALCLLMLSINACSGKGEDVWLKENSQWWV